MTEIVVDSEQVVSKDKVARAFRSSEELASFYRFIHENDLRRECLMAFRFIKKELALGKKKSRGRRKKKLQ